MHTTPPQPPQDIFRVRVAVPVHLYDTFDYSVSAADYEQVLIQEPAGSRFNAPRGRPTLKDASTAGRL